jgi:hypothetical protein
MPNNDPEIQWYDIANLLYGDLVVEENAIQLLANQLEQIRHNISNVADTIPQIDNVDDARLVYSQLSYKIGVLRNELTQFTVGGKNKHTPKPKSNYLPPTDKDILLALTDLLNTYEALKLERDSYATRIEDGAMVDDLNQRLENAFGTKT